MQFVGKKGIALFVLLVSGVVAVGFGSGLLVGRQFPAHRFEKFGNSVYLLDSATGKVCNPFNNPTPNLPAGFVLEGTQDPNGFPIVRNSPPPCEN